MSQRIMTNKADAILSDLSESQIKLLAETADAFRGDVQSDINSSSDLCSPRFVKDFQNRLVLYHALNEDVLKKKTFEFAFAQAARAAGRSASVATNSTQPAQDVVVDGTNFSLKTEASASIREQRIKISKLMEARWIRECTTGHDFLEHVFSRVIPHLRNYQRIVMLRAFRRPGSLVEYHLLEIPHNLLLRAQSLTASDFTPRTDNGSSSAEVKDGSRLIFTLRFDGSVEKVTVENLEEARCIRHATWKIPIARIVESG
jgi:hypothetical protein